MIIYLVRGCLLVHEKASWVLACGGYDGPVIYDIFLDLPDLLLFNLYIKTLASFLATARAS